MNIKLDILILGGTIIDGTQRTRYKADIGIKNGKILVIGDLRTHEAELTIDAKDKIVAPGFIDSHTHDDEALLSDPDLPFKISQGVTTVVTGNCGISMAPLRKGAPIPMPLGLVHDGKRYFETFKSYIDVLKEYPPAVNVIPLVGHTNLRIMAMNDIGRPATSNEVAVMESLLKEALDAGAVGMSAGTYYPPAASATTNEMCKVSRLLGERQALYVAHIRNESDHCIAAVEETLQIGRESSAPVILSHHKHMNKKNFGKSRITLSLIKEAMKCQYVGLDCYPYTASATMLHQDESRLQCRVIITSSEKYPEYQGTDLQEIADEWGVTRLEAAKRLHPATAIYYSMSEEDVQRILAFESTMIGSDGTPMVNQPHPRLWGTFPRVLGHYSRDIGLFPLETAVWKMTGLTASVFGLENRGVLAEGYCADITVFNANTIRDLADYENPITPSDGIDAVIVNGSLAYFNQKHLQTRTGQVLNRVVINQQ